MDNQLQSISKIFTEKLFRIPDYQRGYAWTEKQLKDFWSDIIQLEEGKNHYVGVLTLEGVPKHIYKNWGEDKWILNSKNYEPYYIVDGQQRLTTIIILLQALTESVDDNAELNYTTISEIKKRYIFDSKDGGVSRSYIFGYEKDNPSYEFLKTKVFKEHSTSGYGKEITIYTHNLEFAKAYFVSKLNELSTSEKEVIFKKITQNLLFNIYTITSDIDVFIAFETMNNRGKPLSNLELLKNRLIYLSTKFKTSNTEKNQLRKIINDGWKGIYHYLGKNKDNPLNDDTFLTNHCAIYFGHEIFSNEDFIHERTRRLPYYMREGYEYFLLENKFTYKNISHEGPLTVGNIKAYVESLQEAVEIWFNIYNPTLCKDFTDEEKLLLDRLYRLGMRQFSSLLLSLYLCKPKKEIRLAFLQKLERFIFLSILTSSRYNTVYIDFSMDSVKIKKGDIRIPDYIKTIEERTNELTNKVEFTERLSEKFRNEGFYQWHGIRYFLYEYEVFLRDSSRTKKNKINWIDYVQESDDFISVEHIYPQTAKHDCWKTAFSGYGIKEKRTLNHSLGNLLPLSKPKNSSLQNKCFVDKVDNHGNSVGYKYGSYSENEISGLKEWTPVEILNRGLRLLKFMEKKWELDFKTDETRTEILNLKFVDKKVPRITSSIPARKRPSKKSALVSPSSRKSSRPTKK